ncbi:MULTISPECIES: WecB/TagA/CpsF family glycosyltransferase [Priestia]|jgi:N-acetylglucosaminyldiphosphoundecaprenol N-acetyl-beta-D-mannosaminyltransferase|uniref:N-acetylglucosaminyldiphosphoundecaprenol N-acetyl-beta-D-mannosaminyltransferase n=5 Tax=Priestia TaxID=2800373 RepID=D5DWE1_PRIM1|nr:MULTISPECIES: WecB/TagA/CpsF family glycosyltransferase [Priestia]AVX10965.1 glycosyltransferase [Bacillus sp. Y-01]KOP77027.1 N-acetylmannosaminyltransferase [Bacillus sp. FJAT-21351]KQU18174.1 N-acetylmannosaminyltransferase [Bacillus sp. Leaf75]KRD82936.1 N-acetylmannosaminyltransferase [Bacillus sp. Root147]KRD95216.1 N-acetylmannosaminyltransferase [Bacillus sp. Root239]KRF47502.1 N-acetylmannosaminyltransferase [Bacillus sp. Soil531]MBZ5481843.1 WecB/TagA/CpsF family glycosyltransfe
MKENILGIDVCSDTYDELAVKLLQDIDKGRKSFIVAINPEKIMKAQEDRELKSLLNQATYQIPDGIGVILASKLKKGRIRERVTGIDMMLKLCKEATNNGKRIFLYGAKPGIADEAKAKLEEMFPGILIVGTLNGYEKNEEVIERTINDSGAEIVFVALGSPAQENWIIAHKEKLNPSVYQGVGGSFDVISGRLNRAPAVFQKFGLEWLYRLLKEPWRWKRQLELPRFLLRVLRG